MHDSFLIVFIENIIWLYVRNDDLALDIFPSGYGLLQRVSKI